MDIVVFASLFIVLFIFIIAAMIISGVIKASDNGKPLITCKVKILERLLMNGSAARYIVEDEKGNRLKLRCFKAGELLISEGDSGLLGYRGKTIESFIRY